MAVHWAAVSECWASERDFRSSTAFMIDFDDLTRLEMSSLALVWWRSS